MKAELEISTARANDISRSGRYKGPMPKIRPGVKDEIHNAPHVRKRLLTPDVGKSKE
jgi:hypothetical protein